jgi:electron transport complex protein RnfD
MKPSPSSRHSGTRVANIMQWVMLALLPGVAAQVWYFGWGTLVNIVLCAASCAAYEA